MVAKHVEHANLGNAHLEEVGTLSHTSSHEQSTIASALDGEIVLGGVLLVDEILGSRDEIVKHVLLLQLCACHVPILAILTATTQHSMHVDAATLHERNHVGEVEGIVGDVEAAVAVEQQRVLAVELKALLIGDKERGACAVLACVELHLGGVVLRAEAHLGSVEHAALARSHVVAIDRGGHSVGGEGVEHFLLTTLAADRGRTEGGELNLGETLALGGVGVEMCAVVLGILQYHAVVGKYHILEHTLTLGHNLAPLIIARMLQVGLHKAILGSLGVGEDIDFVAHSLHGGIDVLGVGTHLDEL